MSKLIKAMLNELQNKNGREIDKVILNNIETEYKFDPRIFVPHCLTSRFMENVKRSPRYGFIKDCDDQEQYDNSAMRKQLLADAKALSDGFGDKEFQKQHKKSTTLEKFIGAIDSDMAGFDSKFGNDLFRQSLQNIAQKMPKENFTVQLLCAIAEAKVNAVSAKDISMLNMVEENCKPLVYDNLSHTNTFKTQQEIQDRVLDYFRDSNDKAVEYFRLLSINNIIKTKLASEIYLNTNVEANNKNNSLMFIDAYGYQRKLIHGEEKDYQDAKITDLVKHSGLRENGKIKNNTRNIQYALMKINDEVNAFNHENNPIKQKNNFLQSAVAYMALFDKENVEDVYDFIGISLANPISDILAMDNQAEASTLIKNGITVANKIYYQETGKFLEQDLEEIVI